MKQFVCVRLVQVNGLDLSLFNFDPDLTFAAFFLNADRTLYGRYGTRASRQADEDISMDGFRLALQGALALHQKYPQNRDVLQGKQAPSPAFAVAEDYPSLKERFKSTIDFDGQVARSCIHCHMVGDAERRWYRDAKKAIPDRVLYPWPMPDQIGLTLDVRERARVTNVTTGSIAAQAGFQAGDEIEFLRGQPILSIADVQWVLQSSGDETILHAQVDRAGETRELVLNLKSGWRRGDISWRPTSWDLRRMGTGGMVLQDIEEERRAKLGLPLNGLALYVNHVGQYGEHAVAKRAGFLKADIVVSWDGETRDLTETEIFAHMVQKRKAGDKVPVEVMRGDQRLKFELVLQ